MRPSLPPVAIGEVAARHHLSAASIRRLARDGLVNARRFGKTAWAVDERSLRAYLAKERRGRKGRGRPDGRPYEVSVPLQRAGAIIAA